MFHRFAYTASQAFAVLEIIGGDDARLGGSIRIVKAALGQDKAKFLHIVLRDRSCACFDEFYSICILGKAVGSKCQQHPDACRNQESGKLSFSRGIHCLKETVDVFHSVDDVQGAAYEDDGIDLGETSDVAERTIDDEGQVVMKALCFYQISALAMMVEWEIITPFDLPVVPVVKSMSAIPAGMAASSVLFISSENCDSCSCGTATFPER